MSLYFWEKKRWQWKGSLYFHHSQLVYFMDVAPFNLTVFTQMMH